MKQKAHCPNCGANLEPNVDVSIQGELKPEFRWLAPNEESDGSSKPTVNGTMSIKSDGQNPKEKNPHLWKTGLTRSAH